MFIIIKNRNTYFLIAFVLFLVLVNASKAGINPKLKTGIIEGIVIDKFSNQPLPGVNVLLTDKDLGTTTNIDGYFIIKNIPSGKYEIKFSMMGYQSEIKSNIPVLNNRVLKINVELTESAVLLGESVEITSGYFQKKNDSPVSAKSLSNQEILASAGSAEDVFRAVQNLPGISSIGNKSAELIVRGGSPNENLTLLENIEIQNPYHFFMNGSSIGMFGMINSSIINNVDFISGGFPVKYGDKSSSVFDIKLKDGNRTKLNYDLSMDMSGFGIVLDGPLSENTSLVMSARRGYFDLILELLDKPISPAFWDLTSKITFDISTKNKLSLVGFYFRDDFFKNDVTEDSHNEDMRKFTRMDSKIIGSALGINWKYLYSNNGFLLTTASYTYNKWESQKGSDLIPNRQSDLIAENIFEVKSEITHQFSKKFELKTGLYLKFIESDRSNWRDSDTSFTGFVFPSRRLKYKPGIKNKFGAFINGSIKPTKSISINLGLRSDYFSFIDENKISPRVSLSYFINDRLTFNAAAGVFYQTPSSYQIALDPANETLNSSKSIHYIGGFEYQLSHDIKVSVEGFYKNLSDNFKVSETSRIMTNNLTGNSRGIEFYIQKKMSDEFVGSLSYTYSISKREDNKSKYLFEYDQTHNLSISGGWKISDDLKLGFKLNYASGMPTTPVIGSIKQNGNYYAVYGDKNSERLPDQFQLNLRVDKDFHFDNMTLTAYLDFWNITNSENVMGYYYNYKSDGTPIKKKILDFTIMPILGFKLKF